MMKLRFDLNRLLAKKPEDQKVALPVGKELNEQELATVTGGWGGRHHRGWGGGWGRGWGGGCGGGCGGCW
jgi:bacteriocin-like protein